MVKKCMSFLLALALALTLTVPAYAEDKVTYYEYDAVAGTLKSQTLSSGSYALVSSSGNPHGVDWTEKNNSNTYQVVKDSVSISGNLYISKDTTLILCDGATLTVNGGIYVDNATLTICGEVNGTGKLIATGGGNSAGGDDPVFRYGVYCQGSGSLVICGGSVEATGGNIEDNSPNGLLSCGIRCEGDACVTAYRGSLVAKGGTISGGTDGTSCGIYTQKDMTVGSGASVTATGGNVTATGVAYSYGVSAESGTVHVNDGTLIATGGAAVTSGKDTPADSNGIICKTLSVTGSTGGTVIATAGTSNILNDSETFDIYAFGDGNEPGSYALGIQNGTVQSSRSDKAVRLAIDNRGLSVNSTDMIKLAGGSRISGDVARLEGEDISAGLLPDGYKYEDLLDGDGKKVGVAVVSGSTSTTSYYYYTDPAEEKIEAPKTFDSGIVLYGVMAVMSVTGMAYVGKKRK